MYAFAFLLNLIYKNYRCGKMEMDMRSQPKSWRKILKIFNLSSILLYNLRTDIKVLGWKSYFSFFHMPP